MQAARLAGVDSIGYATKPGKRRVIRSLPAVASHAIGYADPNSARSPGFSACEGDGGEDQDYQLQAARNSPGVSSSAAHPSWFRVLPG
jgi:hypothetical protein